MSTTAPDLRAALRPAMAASDREEEVYVAERNLEDGGVEWERSKGVCTDRTEMPAEESFAVRLQ